jgi:hypothetical protein
VSLQARLLLSVLQPPRELLGLAADEIVGRGEQRLGRRIQNHGAEHFASRVDVVERERVDDVGADLPVEADDAVLGADGAGQRLRGGEVDGVQQLVPHAVSVGEVQDARGLEADKVSVLDEP